MVKILVVFIFLMLVGCNENEKKPKRPVVIKVIHPIDKVIEKSYSGIVNSKNETVLSFKVSGKIESIDTELGKFVKKDEILAVMDDRDYKLQKDIYLKKMEISKNMYEASKAIADNARKQFFRVEKLYNEKAISKKIYDETLSKYKAATAGEMASLSQYEAAILGEKNAKNQLEDTKLKAPYDGYITKVFFYKGANVKAGIPVFYIASQNLNNVRIDVSDLELDKIKKMKSAKFIVGEKEYSLITLSISDVKEFGGVSYPVLFQLPENISIPTGTEGKVKIFLENENKKYKIPVDAVFGEEQNYFLWRVNSENKIEKVKLENLEIFSKDEFLALGVKKEDRVVIRGVNELNEGQEVRVLQR